jgi:nucleoside-diphosphate-sugar epimerase
VNASSPLPRPGFIAEFQDFTAFQARAVGVTGARGVLGSILSGRLRQHGVALATYEGDVNDAAALAAWFASHQFGHFFHFAALVPVAQVEADPLLAYQTNVIGTYNVCRQLVLTQRNCWLFHCSSSHVYRPTSAPVPIAEDAVKAPQSFYGETKLAAEALVATLLGKLQVPHCIGRVFSFTHPRQGASYLVPSLQRRIDALHDGDALDIINPSAVRDIQDAEPVVDAILHLAGRAAVGAVNIGTGTGRSVRQIASALALAAGKALRIEGIDRDAPGSLIADTTRLRTLLTR